MNQHAFIENHPEAPTESPIQAVRLELAAWSERQPKPVQNAVANLDGWLEACACWRADLAKEYFDVDVLACTERAVETLRRATGRA